MSSTKEVIKSITRGLGFDVRKNIPENRFDLRLPLFIKYCEADLVFDVGAHEGQFAISLFENGYQGKIVSFEPLIEPHSRLTEKSKKYPNQWIVCDRMALGASNDVTSINVTAVDTSSSLRRPSHLFAQSTPVAKVVGSQSVNVRRLDDVVRTVQADYQRPMLKIDTQGYEDEVLSGATSVLENCVALLLEMSIRPLYDGQKTWEAIHQSILDAGFVLWDIVPGHRSPTDKRLEQFDGLYLRGLP